MFLIADAHIVNDDARADEFFEMLSALPGDIIFLGDVFDLWIGLPLHEAPVHARFMEWCCREKERRSLTFVEGNHEFFVATERRACFTWTHDCIWREGEVAFVHGDLIDTRNRRYRLLRTVLRSKVMFCLAANPLVGRWIVRRLRSGLATIQQGGSGPSVDVLEEFCQDVRREGVKCVYCGHFHKKGEYSSACGTVLRMVPPWGGSGLVMSCYHKATVTKVAPWRELV